MCLRVSLHISPADASVIAAFAAESAVPNVVLGSAQKQKLPTSYEIYPVDNCGCEFLTGSLNESRWCLKAEARASLAAVVREVDKRATRQWRFSALWFMDAPVGESHC